MDKVYIETNSLIKKLKETLTIPKGKEVSSSSKFIKNNFKFIKSESDLDFIDKNDIGCYFIFSNYPADDLPRFRSTKKNKSTLERPIKIKNKTYFCIYNGKAKNPRKRLLEHLFSKNGISNTKCMRLAKTSKKELNSINVAKKKMNQKIVTLKRVSKSSEEYYLEGININDKQFKNIEFGLVFITADNELGKILIEQTFWDVNGFPPLNARSG